MLGSRNTVAKHSSCARPFQRRSSQGTAAGSSWPKAGLARLCALLSPFCCFVRWWNSTKNVTLAVLYEYDLAMWNAPINGGFWKPGKASIRWSRRTLQGFDFPSWRLWKVRVSLFFVSFGKLKPKCDVGNFRVNWNIGTANRGLTGS